MALDGTIIIAITISLVLAICFCFVIMIILGIITTIYSVIIADKKKKKVRGIIKVQEDDKFYFDSESKIFYRRKASLHKEQCGVLWKEYPNYVEELKKYDKLKMRAEFNNIIKEAGYPMTAGDLEENAKRNRWSNNSPYDYNRVILGTETPNPVTNYINASWINISNIGKAYIAAEAPFVRTKSRFFRMIWDYSVDHIVTFAQSSTCGEENILPIWDQKVGSEEFEDSFHIKKSGLNFRMIIQSVKLIKDTEIKGVYAMELTILRLGVYKTIIHWFYPIGSITGIFENQANFLKNTKRILEITSNSNNPVIVCCSDGCRATGMFIALSYAILQFKNTGYININKIVQEMRNERPCIVPTFEDYEFIYDAVLSYITPPKSLSEHFTDKKIVS